MGVAIELPERIKEEILSITKKENVVDGIRDLLGHELIRKKNKYLFMILHFEKQYGMKFEDFEEKSKDMKMDYETEKDYFDWDMAVTALEDINNEFRGLN
ncbi:MAG: hypothetical protein HY786_06365 [Deltaproteobacteria bacterium]|nr:hypothetical protein [Deltaproteobacteria bacterium]